MKRFANKTKPSSQKQIRTKSNLKEASAKWLKRHVNDPYVRRAKIEGYRSRSAYKLLELDEKYKVIESYGNIVDLGAAPGGWSQIALKQRKISGKNNKIIAVDLLEIEDLEGVTPVIGDFNESSTRENVLEALPENNKKVSLVMSDLAANTTGHAPTDHLKSMQLTEEAFDFAYRVLSPAGNFVAKVFTGGLEKDFASKLKQNFESVNFFKPSASRKHSSEIYLVAKHFRGRENEV